MLCIIDSVDSTNTEVRKNSQIMPHLSAFFAKEQTLGRGRSGKDWLSLKDNLSASFILKPSKNCGYESLSNIGNLAFVSALATLKTIEPYLESKIDILCKWPNDILVNKKKISGILIESDSQQNAINYAIVGIGVNVNNHPNKADYPTTSLFDALKVNLNPIEIAENLCSNISLYLEILKNDGFAKILALYRKYIYGLNQPITVKLPNMQYSGIFEDIDNEGYLLLRCNSGIKKIAVGDLFVG